MRLENSRWGISMAKIMPRTMATAAEAFLRQRRNKA